MTTTRLCERNDYVTSIFQGTMVEACANVGSLPGAAKRAHAGASDRGAFLFRNLCCEVAPLTMVLHGAAFIWGISQPDSKLQLMNRIALLHRP